jgi:rhamnosyltransferase
MRPETLAKYRWDRFAPKSTEQSVCAVLVTYHPDAAMLENLRQVLAQVQGLVIVDNGSSPNEIEALRGMSHDGGFHLIENGVNLGIAEALNQGVRWVKSQGYPWALLFDQDSNMRSGYVQSMFTTWLAHPKRSQIACIHPRYMHPELGCWESAPRAPDGSPVWCLTSGALMPTWIFDKIGWFASEFFIDWVDIEYCFRIRAAGYLIAESQDSILLHDPGHSAPASILGFRFWPSHHNAERRYYVSRNRLAVFRKYFFIFPSWISKAMYWALRDTMKCFLGEKERPRKFRNVVLGTWDGLTGRMGQRQGL